MSTSPARFEAGSSNAEELRACHEFLCALLGADVADVLCAWNLRSFSLRGTPWPMLAGCSALQDYYWAWDSWVLQTLAARGVALKSTDISLPELGRRLLETEMQVRRA